MKERELSQKDAKAKAEKLLAGAKTVFLATNGSHGHPNVRAMMPVKIEGADTVWFATSLESSKIIELVKDNKAAIYGYTPNNSLAEFRLWGEIAILDDHESRKYIWREEMKKHFSGIDDRNMRILRFNVVSGLYAKEGKSGIFSN
jgi:general stress protein 26